MSMDFIACLQYILVLLALGILLWPAKPKNSAPGPPAIPLIGHLHLLGASPHRSFLELSKRYGQVMSLKLGSVSALVVSNPEMAREVLQTHDSVFASRPPKLAAKYIFRNKDILFSPCNDHFKRARRLLSTELFTSRRVESFCVIILDELSKMLSQLAEASKDERVVEINTYLKQFDFNVTTRILMRNVYAGSKQADQFVNIVDQVSQCFGKFAIGDCYPKLAWLDYWQVRSMKNIAKELDAFLTVVFDEHKSAAETPDFVDLMKTFYSAEEQDTVRAVLLDLLLAATDTSQTAIEWTLAELMNKPKVLWKVQLELETVVGRNRAVHVTHLPELNFLDAVIKESLRLHPPAPLFMPHYSTSAVHVGGYDVAENTACFINAYAIGRDPNVWPRAEEFDPERFIGSDISWHGRNFELIPFSSGRRLCPGPTVRMITRCKNNSVGQPSCSIRFELDCELRGLSRIFAGQQVVLFQPTFTEYKSVQQLSVSVPSCLPCTVS